MTALTYTTQIQTHVVWCPPEDEVVKALLKEGSWTLSEVVTRHTMIGDTTICVLVRVINKIKDRYPFEILLTEHMTKG